MIGVCRGIGQLWMFVGCVGQRLKSKYCGKVQLGAKTVQRHLLLSI